MSEHNFKHREIEVGYEINPPLIGANAGLIESMSDPSPLFAIFSEQANASA